MKIEALHDFHDAQFSIDWAQRFQPTPPRLRLFTTILDQIKFANYDEVRVLELGIGPGFLAHHLLEGLPHILYEGLDFSNSMLDIAAKRTMSSKTRIIFTQADLVNDLWSKKIERKPNIIVSTWALHDLFSKRNIYEVYRTACELLPKGGLLLNGDFIKPQESLHDYEGGRMMPSEHIELLCKAGFIDPQCIEKYEIELEHPTTSNNYACFKAIKN